MMDLNNDPWSWTYNKQPVAPLGAQINQPMVQAPNPIMVGNSPEMNMLQSGGINAIAKGGEAAFEAGKAAYQANQTAQALAPLSASINSSIGATVPAASSIAAPSAVTSALAAEGLASAAPAAMSTAVPAAAGIGSTAAMAGGEAALAAMGPVGWAIGAGLLAKKLGIF